MGSLDEWLNPAAHQLIDLALEEDLGRGDVTTDALIPPALRAFGRIVARKPLVVAGVAVAAEIFRRVDPAVSVVGKAGDGDALAAGDAVLEVRGLARGLLRAERVALNFLQRLSGIATLTRTYVEATAGTKAKIADTRKTYPGARPFEKMAVIAGGGSNHRYDLGSGVLIKDNHRAVLPSIKAAIDEARARAPHGLRIEIEVDTLAQLEEALLAGADIVLLDNFRNQDIAEAVRIVRRRTPRPLLEVSGGITLERVPVIARLGVDIISVGALTHSAPAVDLALDLEVGGPAAP